MNKPLQLLRSSFVVSLLALPLAVSAGCSSRGAGGDGVPATQTQDNNGGGGGGGGGGVFESSTDDSKKLSELSEAEQGQLCAEYESYFRARVSDDDLTRLTCYAFSALFGSEGGASCEQSAQSCISSGGFEEEDTSGECEAAPFEMCDATVAELEDCYTGTVDAIDALIPRLSCDLFSDPASIEGLSGRPASCDAIEARCPGFLDSEDDSNNGGNNGGNFDSSISITLDGEPQEDFGWSNSGTGGSQFLMLRLNEAGDDTITVDLNIPAVPATLDMSSASTADQATVTLTLGGVDYVNVAGDAATGTLSADDSEELGPQINFNGEVVSAEGERLQLEVMFDGF